MRSVVVILFLMLSANIFSQKKDVVVPYTLADRERLVRVEVRLDNIEKRMDNIEKRMEALEQMIAEGDRSIREELSNEIRQIRNAIWGLVYAMLGLTGVFVAVLVWDRRKTLYPVLKRMEIEEARLDDEIAYRKKVDKFLKDLSKKDKKIQEAMKHAGLL